jgi:methionine synthase I (cobalamin-dependent)
MHPLIESLLRQRPLITDGAWGTQLQARGLPVGDCPDHWNLTHPDAVADVAAAYVAAGSRIILTNTFGANRIRLAEFGLGERAAEINRAGAQISRRAAGNGALVFASMGPTGKMLVAGDVSEQEVSAAFAEQADALRAGGADGIVVETMAELQEALLAIEAARRTGLPVVACMTFDTAGRTMMGVSPAEAARELTAAGSDVVGSNCGNGIEAFAEIARQMRAATGLPLWMKPNAGRPEWVDGRVCYQTAPAEFARVVPELVAAGADFVGGCCGTSPAHLRAVVEAVGGVGAARAGQSGCRRE